MLLSQSTDKRQRYLLLHNFQRFLPASAIEQLQLYSFYDGEYLCQEGENARFLYFLVDGRCKVTRFLNNGKESLLCFCHNFAVVGEFELVHCFSMKSRLQPDSQPISQLAALTVKTNVQAIGPVWCLCLPLTAAQELLTDSPLFLRFLCEHLCQKLIRNTHNLSISLNYPVDERLASYIYCTCQNNFFQDNYTHLAEYLGCSHRQLLRVLRRFCEEGILKKEDHAYHIADGERLKKLAGDIYSP